MVRIRTLAGTAGAAAVAAALVGAPAYAGTTLVSDYDSPYGAYAGNVRATLIQNLVINGGGTTTCTASQMNGTVDSDGDPLTINSTTVTGCSGTAGSVTALNTPWTGKVTYVTGFPDNRNATISLSGFTVRATVFGFYQCTYGPAALSVPAFNPNNGSRPVAAVAEAQVNLAGITLTKSAGGAFCPSSATITQGVYKLNGETSAGSGVFTKRLSVSGTYP